MLRLNIMIDEEFRRPTDNGNEFQYLGSATLRDEALELVLAKQQCSLSADRVI